MDMMDWIESVNVEVTDDDLDDLKTLFQRFADLDGYPIIPVDVWVRINTKHRQKNVRLALCQHIYNNKVPIPLSPPTVEEARIAFDGLCAMSSPFLVFRPFKPFQPRVSYHYLSEPEVILVRNNTHNDASNHFQWTNRMRCDGWGDPSPLHAWSSVKNLYGLRWTFWSMDRDGPTSRKVWRSSFLNSTNGIYHAAQFRPSAAKSVYGWTGAEVIVDPSCGWGDRLCGFYATTTAKKYIGCDPNPDTWKVYRDQCAAYERWLGNPDPRIDDIEVNGRRAFHVRGVKEAIVVNGPFEDIPWLDLVPEGADLVFTSPPYFSTEKYASNTDQSRDQSWSRYTTFNAWLENFYFHVVRVSGELIRKRDGIVMLNIADPVLGYGKTKVRHKACDPAVDYAQSIGMQYAGAAGLELALRPSSSSDRVTLQSGSFIEPVWMFTWGRDYPQVPLSSVEDMLGVGPENTSNGYNSIEDA